MIEDFLRVTRGHPGQTAITHNGRALSYRQLGSLVLATARRLGPRPGPVGVMATRSSDTIVGLLGVLAAGGVYCPIDPAFPAARQRALVAASGCRVVLAPRGLPTPPGVMVIDLPRDATPEGEGWIATSDPEDPEDPAYLLFTSGSTGTPKGVLTPRRAIVTAVRALRALFELTPADRVLQFASLNWDTCLEEILPALTTGATLVIDDEAYAGSFPRLLRMIEAERITVLDLPTAFWHELVNHLAEDELGLPPCVRLVVIGGEAVSPARLADWRALHASRVRLLNTYGCTETTLVTHAAELGGEQEGTPIGRALPHVLEHVTEQGELLIAGPSLALGYQGLPEQTEARFRVHDLGHGPRRYFHTGDRVLRDADGLLLHRGRLDGEIKVRGIRVDPGEVEAEISAHPRVAGAVVVGVTVADHTALAAYVVPRALADAETLGADVLAYLRDRVPRHLLPARLTVVAELVHTPSGKVDRAGSHQLHTSRHRAKEAIG